MEVRIRGGDSRVWGMGFSRLGILVSGVEVNVGLGENEGVERG